MSFVSSPRAENRSRPRRRRPVEHMTHYQRAPGQPLCQFGAACTRKKADHYRSLDHPPNHPKLLHAANSGMKHQHQQLDRDAVALDRSRCALQGRDGDDPSTATYTCAGCGSKIVGFGRWRNHMKRANKRGGGDFPTTTTGSAAFSTAAVSKKESFRALAERNLAAHREHDPASPAADELAQVRDATRAGASISSATAKVSAMQQAAREAPLQSRVEGKAVWRLSGKEKRALAEAAARGEAPRAVAAEFASRTVPACKPTAADAPRSVDASERDDGEEKQPVGKRWLATAAGKSEKRQRKFY